MRYDDPLTPGRLYHLYSRGNNRENLFRRADDYDLFHALMWEHVAPVADIFAFSFLPNHFHLIAQWHAADDLPDSYRERPSQPVSNWLNAFVRRTNRHRDRVGALFQRPFGRVLVKDEAHRHVLGVYVHINPQRHGIVSAFREWPYSSLAELSSYGPTQLRRDDLFAWYGGRSGFERALRRWEEWRSAMDLMDAALPELAVGVRDPLG